MAHYSQKTSYKYPARVTEGRDPPPQIKQELQQARVFASQQQRRAELAQGGVARQRRSAVPMDPTGPA